jgi:hypothetical protein
MTGASRLGFAAFMLLIIAITAAVTPGNEKTICDSP